MWVASFKIYNAGECLMGKLGDDSRKTLAFTLGIGTFDWIQWNGDSRIPKSPRGASPANKNDFVCVCVFEETNFPLSRKLCDDLKWGRFLERR